MMRGLVFGLGIAMLVGGAPSDEVTDQEGVRQSGGDIQVEAPPYDTSVVDSIDCDLVSGWDGSVFDSAGEENMSIKTVKEGSFFERAGFSNYSMVFGIPIVASKNIGSIGLTGASRVLASLLDSNDDGEADNPQYIAGMIKYRVVFGFFASGAESEDFWTNKDKRPGYKAFMEQYLCNMHFVEVWQADLSPIYYTSLAERQALVDAGNLDAESPNILKRCGAATTEKFDLSLWYYLFSVYYYGVIDHITPEEIETANNAMLYIQNSRGFTAHYAADSEMTLADFLAWSTLTRIGALECHCTQTAVQNHWRPCRSQDLPPPLVELIDSLPSIPNQIPNPAYPQPRPQTPLPKPEPTDAPPSP